MTTQPPDWLDHKLSKLVEEVREETVIGSSLRHIKSIQAEYVASIFAYHTEEVEKAIKKTVRIVDSEHASGLVVKTTKEIVTEVLATQAKEDK